MGIIQMDVISYLQGYLENDNTKLLYMLGLILMANIIDFLLGYVNAKLNTKVQFQSGKAIFGILRKVLAFIVLVYFIPVSLLAPEPIGLTAVYVLLGGYLLSELNSILSHLKLSDDGKSEVFAEFIEVVFKKKGGK